MVSDKMLSWPRKISKKCVKGVSYLQFDGRVRNADRHLRIKISQQ